jgi:hypothetical protein
MFARGFNANVIQALLLDLIFRFKRETRIQYPQIYFEI